MTDRKRAALLSCGLIVYMLSRSRLRGGRVRSSVYVWDVRALFGKFITLLRKSKQHSCGNSGPLFIYFLSHSRGYIVALTMCHESSGLVSAPRTAPRQEQKADLRRLVLRERLRVRIPAEKRTSKILIEGQFPCHSSRILLLLFCLFKRKS